MDFRRLICFVLVLDSFATFGWSWNHTFLVNYVNSFVHLIGIQEVVWFLSCKLKTAQSENPDVLIKGFSEVKLLTQYVWTNRTDVRMITIGSKRAYIGVVISTGAKDPVMNMHNRLLIGRHFILSLIIYTSKVSDIRPVEELMDLLHRENFANSAVYFQTVDGTDNLFGFNQYPRYSLQHKTDYMLGFRLGMRKAIAASKDVEGYKFYTPLKQDIPSVFTYIGSNGKKKVQGSTYRILAAFMEFINASLVEYRDLDDDEIINMKSVLDQVRTKKIQIAAHAYALFQADDDVDKSYPIMVVKWCLMIPLRNSVSTFLYTLQPFEWNVWYLVLTALIVICILDYLFWRRGVTHRQLGDLWLNNFCHMLNICPAFMLVRTTDMRFLYYAVVFWFGFFLSANYTSYLGSFLTVSLFRQQINTIDDLVKARLPVMIIDYELNFLLAEGYVPPAGFKELLLAVDSATFYNHQLAMNASFAYFITDDRWRILHEAQMHLTLKLFKFSDICFGSYHLAFPMEKDSPIWRDLEYFLYRIHSSGLFKIYETKALQHALAAGHIRRAMESNEYAVVGMDHLAVMFGLLILMYLIGVVFVILEIACYSDLNR